MVTLDSMALNSSPLRGQSGVFFVSTPEELGEAPQLAHQNTVDRSGSDGFFLGSRTSKVAEIAIFC